MIFGGLALLIGKIDICACILLCKKLNFEQLLLEVFFNIIPIFSSVKHQNESNFPFWYIIWFQTYYLWRPLVTLIGETDICTHGLSRTKFNSKQLSFKHFFHIMRIFDSVELQSESNFLFLYIIRFQTYCSLEDPNSTPWGESYVLEDFFVQNSISNKFYLKLFSYNGYFGSVEPLSDSNFLFFYDSGLYWGKMISLWIIICILYFVIISQFSIE